MDRDDIADAGTLHERGAITPGLDPLGTGRAEREAPSGHDEGHRVHDQSVSVALQDAAPADPARIHDVERPVSRSGPQEADLGKHVEYVERVDRGPARSRLVPEPMPGPGRQARPEPFRR